MRQPRPFITNYPRTAKSSTEIARSAHRLIRLHKAYVIVQPQQEPSLRKLYLRELIIMMRRASKMGFYLIIHGVVKGRHTCSSYLLS